MINIILIIITIIITTTTLILTSEWMLDYTIPLTYPQGIQFSKNDERFAFTDKEFIKAFKSDNITDALIAGYGPVSITFYHLAFSKKYNFVILTGNKNTAYNCPYPAVAYLAAPSREMVTNNTRIQETDTSYNSTHYKIITCGNKFVNIFYCPGGVTCTSEKEWPINNVIDPNCEYSDVDDNYGWVDGKSFYLKNKNHGEYLSFSNSSLPSNIRDIKFLKGDRYPAVLMSSFGIVKTAASQSDWKIIPTVHTGHTMVVSKDEKFFAIGTGNERVYIYSASEFRPFNTYDSTIPSNYIFKSENLTGQVAFELAFSNSGNNLIATIPVAGKLKMFKNCPTEPHIFWNCSETCGDGLIYREACDLGFGNEYDGCYDNCTVEENFTCTKDLTTYKSTCLFNGNFLLKLLNITKNQPTIKEADISLLIYPPLNSFKNLTPEQLASIFTLPPKFTGLSYSYDSDTGELNINFLVNEEMENEPFYINFNPSKIGIQKYFANSSYQIQLTEDENSQIMPFYFENDELASISLMISYSSVFIPIAGWILIFLGLFSKSLSGLETMMTFQFCGVTLHWLRCRFFMGLKYANSIKYLSGFNVAYQAQTTTVSIETASTYSILRTFDIDFNFFDSNLNLVFLFCVPFLIAVFVLRISIFKQKRKRSKKNFNHSKLIKLKEYKCFALNSLLYSISAIYIPFLEYFILFTEIGQKNHAASWALSLAYILLFAFVLLKFFKNPSNFETFWSSFRLHRILLHHYYFYVLALTFATVLLIKLPTIPYLSAIPCILMLIYTLVLRPYLTLKENIRSALNYLVMCSFLAFNTYVLRLPSDEISSKFVYMLLVINLGIILPIVFIFAFVLCLINCYYKFYKIPKMTASEIESNNCDEMIINELNKANLEKKMKRMEQTNDYLNKLDIPNENIFDFSNRLIIEPEIEKQEIKKRNIGSLSTEQNIGTNKQERNNLRKKIISELKLEKKEDKTDKGKVYNFKEHERIEENFENVEELKDNKNENKINANISNIKNSNKEPLYKNKKENDKNIYLMVNNKHHNE